MSHHIKLTDLKIPLQVQREHLQVCHIIVQVVSLNHLDDHWVRVMVGEAAGHNTHPKYKSQAKRQNYFSWDVGLKCLHGLSICQLSGVYWATSPTIALESVPTEALLLPTFFALFL